MTANAAPAPRRILVLTAADLRRTLDDLSVFESLTAAGAQLVVVSHGDQAALLDPTLLDLRLRYTPDRLEAPLSLSRETVSADQLQRWRCDAAVLLDDSFTAGRLASISNIEPRWGMVSGTGRWWLTEKVDRPVADASRPIDDRRPLIESMGLTWRRRERLHQPASWPKLADERLRKANLDPEAPLVGVYLGRTGGARRQRWPVKRFISFIQRLRRQQPSWQLVLLSTDDELWSSVKVHESTGRIVPVIGPDMAIQGLAAVIAALDLVIAADSVVLDLARVLGVQRLGLFGYRPERAIDDGELRLVERGLAKLSVDRVLAAVPELPREL